MYQTSVKAHFSTSSKKSAVKKFKPDNKLFLISTNKYYDN